MFLWESIPFHSPPEFLLHGDVFPWLVQWPTVASCGLYLPRPDSAPGISVHGAGLEVANGIYVRTGFKVGRIWKNCGALKLFVHLCAELPRKQGWPAINDYILEVYRIWTHMKTLIYTYMCIICIYIYTVLYNIIYILYQIHPNTVVIGRWSSEDQVGNSDAFQKRGTSLALLKRGRAVGCLWSR